VVTDALIADRPAVAALELASIARGVVCLDAMAKRAENAIVAARTISPGRYLILLSGTVAEIEEAVHAGVEAAAEDLVDHVIIRDPHASLRDALASEVPLRLEESLAIIEISAVSSTLLAVDRTLKETEVNLIELRLGAGLSGKGVFTLTGSLPMIQAARDVAVDAIRPERLIRVEVIAQPHPDLPRHLLGAEPARVRGHRP
jgi:microcompartment protein CcmL/EutN